MLDQHVIETPENISFGYDVAGIGSRFLATLVDTLIQGTLTLFLFLVLLIVSALGSNLTDQLPTPIGRWLPTLGTVVLVLVLFLIQIGYFIVCEIFTGGRSPGKELVGLRVIKENGYPLTAIDAIIRNLVRIVDFLPFGYGFGVIAMFLNERSKRLGDFAAGTLVVRTGRSVKLSDLQKSTPSAYAAAAVAFPGVERLKEADIELIESFLQRQRTLKNANALGVDIAQRVSARMATREAEEYAALHTPTGFLEQVVAAFRARANGL